MLKKAPRKLIRYHSLPNMKAFVANDKCLRVGQLEQGMLMFPIPGFSNELELETTCSAANFIKVVMKPIKNGIQCPCSLCSCRNCESCWESALRNDVWISKHLCAKFTQPIQQLESVNCCSNCNVVAK